MDTVGTSVIERTWINLKRRVRNVWKRRKYIRGPSEVTYLLQDKYSTICMKNDLKYFKYSTLTDDETSVVTNGGENASQSSVNVNKCHTSMRQKTKKKRTKRLKRALLNTCRYIGQGGATVGIVNVIPSYDCNCDLRTGRSMRHSSALNVPSFCIHDIVYTTSYYC